MMFIKTPNGKNIEVFYMNENDCKNYNQFHGYREIDINYVREGYYYGSMIGPFNSVKEASAVAISVINII
jgi:hypothetical protein